MNQPSADNQPARRLGTVIKEEEKIPRYMRFLLTLLAQGYSIRAGIENDILSAAKRRNRKCTTG